MARRWQTLGIERPDGLPMCVQATRVGIVALARVGVTARPLACGITVFNQTALRLYTQGVPQRQWPEEARSVAISPDLPNDGPGWNGHLLIEHDDFFCDLSLGAFTRPCRIDTAPTVWAKGTDMIPVATEHGPAWISYRPDRPVIVRMDPKPHLASWRRSHAWRANRRMRGLTNWSTA